MLLLESYSKSFALSRILPVLSRDVGRNLVVPTLPVLGSQAKPTSQPPATIMMAIQLNLRSPSLRYFDSPTASTEQQTIPIG
jgi:hypothetical protein